MAYPPPAAFDLVAIGASAGGLQALRTILSRLPPDFPAAIVIVQHIPPDCRSRLAMLLDQRSALTVHEAIQGERLQRGSVYVAPPGRHLVVEPSSSIQLCSSQKVQFSRPSATRLFQSVAQVYGSRAIGVVLTGMNSDGSEGVKALKAAGGVTMAQDETSSAHFAMPAAAIRTGCVDFVLPLEVIASALVSLVMVPGAAPFFRVPPVIPLLP